MTILQINKFYFVKGGAERHYFDLTQLLEKAGHTVIPFAMHHPQNLPTPWARFFVREKTYRSRTSIVQSLRDARDILWNFEASRNLEALISETKPDLAHLHNIAHQLSPSIIHVLRRHKIPLVQTLHDYKLIDWNYLHYPRSIPWGEQLVLRTERTLHQLLRSYSYVNHFIAPSQFMKRECVGAGVPENKITVIPYCLPHPISPYEGEGKGEVKPYLLFVGRLSPEKGLDVLLAAMREIPHVHLKIIGTGPMEPTYQLQVPTLRSGSRHKVVGTTSYKLSNVEFLGHQDQAAIQRLMAEAMALIVPSLWPENSPLVIYEACAQGIPVIASDIGGIPELVQHRKTGFLVPAGDSAALAHAIETFSALPPTVQKAMGHAGKLYIQNVANPHHLLRRTLEVYELAKNATLITSR